jgi:hypothetical protein
VVHFPPIRYLLVGLGVLKRPGWTDDIDDHLEVMRRALLDPPYTEGPSYGEYAVKEIFSSADSTAPRSQDPESPPRSLDQTLMLIGLGTLAVGTVVTAFVLAIYLNGAPTGLITAGTMALVSGGPWLTARLLRASQRNRRRPIRRQ